MFCFNLNRRHEIINKIISIYVTQHTSAGAPSLAILEAVKFKSDKTGSQSYFKNLRSHSVASCLGSILRVRQFWHCILEYHQCVYHVLKQGKWKSCLNLTWKRYNTRKKRLLLGTWEVSCFSTTLQSTRQQTEYTIWHKADIFAKYSLWQPWFGRYLIYFHNILFGNHNLAQTWCMCKMYLLATVARIWYTAFAAKSCFENFSTLLR